MERVTLPHSGIEISRLGFGCAALTAHNDRSKAVRVLEAALDAGVTHFDVARMYGMGHAESILGSFLKGKRDRVTVTTKFGIEATGGALAKNERAFAIVKSAIRKSRLLNSIVRRGVKAATPSPGGKFAPSDAQASLELSLRMLGTDRVDFFMLHRSTESESQREDLIAWLEDRVREGTVRAFGPSTDAEKLPSDLATLPSAHRVVQFNSNTVNRNIDQFSGRETRDVLTFAPMYRMGRLAITAKENPSQFADLAERAGVDPTATSSLAPALLNDALERNPSGAVLFATTVEDRVLSNVEGAMRGRTVDQREALGLLVRALNEKASDA